MSSGTTPTVNWLRITSLGWRVATRENALCRLDYVAALVRQLKCELKFGFDDDKLTLMTEVALLAYLRQIGVQPLEPILR